MVKSFTSFHISYTDERRMTYRDRQVDGLVVCGVTSLSIQLPLSPLLHLTHLPRSIPQTIPCLPLLPPSFCRTRGPASSNSLATYAKFTMLISPHTRCYGYPISRYSELCFVKHSLAV